MATEVWDPFREMARMRRELDRMMEEMLRPTPARGERMLYFPVNVYQADGDVVVEAALPGVKPEDVNISITGRTLTITAERKMLENIKEENVFGREIRVGRFSRQIELPFDAQADKADASYNNGILTLKIPKAAMAKSTQIQVKAETK